MAASAHHRLQTAADTHSAAAAALIKKSAASKVSQSKSAALRSSSRFSGEAAVLIFPEPRRRVRVGVGGEVGWGTNQGRTKLHMAERWRQEWLRNVSLKVSL